MVEQSKLEQLVAAGIGGGRHELGLADAAKHEITKQFGNISPMSGNVFMCTGRQVQALQHRNIDLLMIEVMPKLAWGSTSSSRYISADYPSMPSMYDSFLTSVKKQLGADKWAQQVLGCNFIVPVPARKAKPPLISFSFVDMGPRGNGSDTVFDRNTNTRSFAPRFKMEVFDALMSNLFSQALSNATILERAAGRKIRIGLPRLYGSVGGVYAARLIELLVEAAAPHMDTVELYLFVPNDDLDKSLRDPVWPERVPAKPKRKFNKNRRPNGPRRNNVRTGNVVARPDAQ